MITGVAKRTPLIRDVNRVPAARQILGDRLSAGLDYEVNLKAGIEILALPGKVDPILSRHLDELARTQREERQRPTRLVPANGDTQRGRAQAMTDYSPIMICPVRGPRKGMRRTRIPHAESQVHAD